MYWQGDSLMLNPHEAFGVVSGKNKLISAVVTSFALAACGANIKEPKIPSSLFAELSAKPTESYVVVPYVKTLDDKSEPIRKQKLVIKISEKIDPKAINEQGKRGTNFCSGFQIIDTVTDDKGKMQAIYKTASSDHCLVPVEFSQGSVAQLSASIDIPPTCSVRDKKAELASVITTHCTFKPNAY